MKHLVDLCVLERDMSPEEFSDLLALFPKGRMGATFTMRVPEQDSVVMEVVAYLGRIGMRSSLPGRRKQLREYSFKVRREYDDTDFRASRCLQVEHDVLIAQSRERDAEGRLVIPHWDDPPAEGLAAGFRIGAMLFRGTVVSAELRDKIQASGLSGPQFQAVVLRAEDGSSQISRDFFEMTSSVTLPPLANTGKLWTRRGPFTGDYSDVVAIADPPYVPGEMHYRQSELKKVEPFDFALSFEKFPEEHFLVASQRFYQFAMAEKLKLSWTPVRIDLD